MAPQCDHRSDNSDNEMAGWLFHLHVTQPREVDCILVRMHIAYVSSLLSSTMFFVRTDGHLDRPDVALSGVKAKEQHVHIASMHVCP